MTTVVRTALSSPLPCRLAAPLLAAAILVPAAALAEPSYDDVSYGDIPAATFAGEPAATSSGETGALAYGDVVYGPHATFALEFPSRDALPADGHDDVTYPAAPARRDRVDAAVASSTARESAEVRASHSEGGAAPTIPVEARTASGVPAR